MDIGRYGKVMQDMILRVTRQWQPPGYLASCLSQA